VYFSGCVEGWEGNVVLCGGVDVRDDVGGDTGVVILGDCCSCSLDPRPSAGRW
jgi:hypothetical protein